MAPKPLRLHRFQQPTAQPQRVGLQKSIVQWLYEHRRRDESCGTPGVPYTQLVKAVAADKTNVIAMLRQMVRQGLVEIPLPRGAWTRCVVLTEQGQEYAKTLLEKERRSTWQTIRDGAEALMPRDKPTRNKRRERERDVSRKRDQRQTRRRSKRGYA